MTAWAQAAAPRAWPCRGSRPAGGCARHLGRRHRGDRRRPQEGNGQPGLQEPAKKALATLDREWDGLIAHRDYPMTGLDNNISEVRHEVARVKWATRKEGRLMMAAG
jgi:hypothetical protein